MCSSFFFFFFGKDLLAHRYRSLYMYEKFKYLNNYFFKFLTFMSGKICKMMKFYSHDENTFFYFANKIIINQLP